VGQKVNPIGIRIGIVRTWQSRWFATGRNFVDILNEDGIIRKYIRKRLARAGISHVEIERAGKKATVTIFTSRPGIVIGHKGTEVDALRDELAHLTGKDIHINIQEINRPEIDAYLIGDQVARQLESRVAFRRAMKKSIASAMKMGAQGIKITCSGRLGGAELARSETYAEGRVPLHTLRADIDYARVPALTTYGIIGIKVWVFKGEIYGRGFKAKKTRERKK